MHNIIYVLATALLTAHAVASSPLGGTTSQVNWASVTEELEQMVEKEKQLVDSYQPSEHEETISQVDWASFTEELEQMVEKEKQLMDSYQTSEHEETISHMYEIIEHFFEGTALETIFKDSDLSSKLDAIFSSLSAEDLAKKMSELIEEITETVENGGTSSKLMAGFESYSSSSSSSSADEHASSENEKTESNSSSEQGQGPVSKGQEGGGKKEGPKKSVKKGQESESMVEASSSSSTGSIVSNLNTSTEEPSATTITRIALGALATICVVALVVTTLRKRKRNRTEILPMSNRPSSSMSVNDEDLEAVDDEVVESNGSMKTDKDAGTKSAHGFELVLM